MDDCQNYTVAQDPLDWNQREEPVTWFKNIQEVLEPLALHRSVQFFCNTNRKNIDVYMYHPKAIHMDVLMFDKNFIDYII